MISVFESSSTGYNYKVTLTHNHPRPRFYGGRLTPVVALAAVRVRGHFRVMRMRDPGQRPSSAWRVECDASGESMHTCGRTLDQMS